MRPGILLALAAVACVQPLELPPEPGSGPPALTSVEPSHAYAGAVVRLAGDRLQGAEVRFAGSGPVTPKSADPLGKWVDVTVPFEARTGPVVASTTAGRSDGSVVFTSDGAGRLRQGRERAAGDLRELVNEPAWLANGGFLALATPSTVLGLVSRAAAFAPLPIASAYWRAVSRDGRRLVVLRPYRTGRATLGVELYDTADFKLIRAFDLTPEPGASLDGRGAGLAVTGDGSHALVSDGKQTWALDFSATPAVTATGRAPDGVWDDPMMAWVGGTRFAIGGPGGAWILDAAHLESSPQVATTASTSSLTASGTLLAVLTGNLDTIELVDTSDDAFPKRDLTLAWPGQLNGVALSHDGRRLAGLSPTNVWTWDVETGRVLGQTAVESGHGISATPDGLFVTGGAAGLALVSAESGEKIAVFPVAAGYESPTLRHVACADSETEDDVLFLASRTFGTVDAVDARSLRRTLCTYPKAPPPAAGALVAYAAPLRGRAAALVERDDEAVVWREPEDDGPGEWWTLGAPIGFDQPSEAPVLAMTPEGTLAVRARTLPNGPMVARVASLAGPWPPEKALEISEDGDVLFVAAGPGNRVAYASVASIVLLDGAKAAEGTRAELFRQELGENEEPTGLALSGRFAVVRLANRTSVEPESRFLVVDAKTGALLADWHVADATWVDRASVKAFVVAPGEQRIEWLEIEPDSAQARWMSLAFDPAAGAPELDTPVPVPSLKLGVFSVPEVLSSPDGERVWIVGGTDDRIVQLE